MVPPHSAHPHPRNKTPPLRTHSQQHQRPQHHRRRNSPKEKLVLVIDRRHRIEIHAKVARQEGQRQEERRDQRQLAHALVLVGGDAVEDERGQVLCGADAHVGAVRQGLDVVLHVLEIHAGHRGDLGLAVGGLETGFGFCGGWGRGCFADVCHWAVVAEGFYEAAYGDGVV